METNVLLKGNVIKEAIRRIRESREDAERMLGKTDNLLFRGDGSVATIEGRKANRSDQNFDSHFADIESPKDTLRVSVHNFCNQVVVDYLNFLNKEEARLEKEFKEL